MSLKKKIIIIVALILTLMWGVLSGYFLNSLINNKDVVTDNSPPQCQSGDQIELICKTGNSFFSDSFVVISQEGEKKFFLTLDINRKEEGGQYSHYYNGELVYEGKNYPLRSTFLSPSSEVQVGSIFSQFERVQAADLSARYTYIVVIPVAELGDIKFSLNSNSDFVNKDSILNIVTYSSSEVEVDVNSETVIGNGMSKRTESTDSSKYLFFEGYDQANLLSEQLIFWDEDNNFYLLDKTVVNGDYPGYKSHNWLLYKDFNENFTKKAFEFNLSRISDGKSKILRWQIDSDTPEIQGEIETTTDLEVNNYDFEIAGELDINGLTKEVRGMATSIRMRNGVVNPLSEN